MCQALQGKYLDIIDTSPRDTITFLDGAFDTRTMPKGILHVWTPSVALSPNTGRPESGAGTFCR